MYAQHDNKETRELKDRLINIKKKVSQLRKNNKETSSVNPLLFNALPKIKMAEATFEKEDIEKTA
jgi:hypothetical protein